MERLELYCYFSWCLTAPDLKPTVFTLPGNQHHHHHNDSDLPIMLWYQQREDSQSMTLIVFGYATEVPNYEGKFKEQFELRKESAVKGDLIIRRANLFHSAVYLCALTAFGIYEAHFGGGTRLTVLECQNWKDNKQYKTLVCVASDFYPDHVSVFWQIDGGNVTRGVATDSSARRDGKYYRITSRLMVPLIQWYTPEKNFSCTVSFFNGNKTTYSSNWVRGIEGRYLRITQNAKLSYAVLIVKSSFFGVFVVLLLYKLKVGPPSYCVQAT
uniref:Ig-like domain-containing protein n=1 Tax=Seriola lalandi dorsalis TaxID=1841481 RepID=A0A3B4XJ95_SERLL